MSEGRIDIPGKGAIQFEGADLPEGAKYFEEASFYAALPEDVQDWVLDLRYAWGRVRHSPSSLVLRACDEIESRIYSEREDLFAHLRRIFEKVEPAKICQDWLTAIQMMRGSAERRDTCSWTVAPVEGEVSYYLTQAIGLVRSMEKAQGSILPPGLVEHIETAPEDEQVRFIIRTTDSMSS